MVKIVDLPLCTGCSACYSVCSKSAILMREDKESFFKASERFLIKDLTERPMIFEIFTESKDESDALYTIRNLEIDASLSGKNIVKKIVGDKGVDFLKKIVGR